MKSRISTIGAGLCFVLAVQVGVTVAATGTSGASASEALRGSVTIVVKGKRSGSTTSAGRFSITGAISDRGRFVDGGGHIIVRTLVGAKGTMWIKVGETSPYPCQCNWRITRGTKAYAGLRGRGRESGLYLQRSVDVTMSGTVSR